MPAQRRARGSYAKYICHHCRKRKIKCDLPEEAGIQPSTEAQSVATSCQRCVAKGLDCVVDFTILGRPSHSGDLNMTKSRLSSESSLGPSTERRSSDVTLSANTDEAMLDSQDNVDDYLMVRPEKTPDVDQTGMTPQRRRPKPADKFQAMTDPSYLLSTLLQRDKLFASRWTTNTIEDVDALDLMKALAGRDLDRFLVWQRLFYPDIPTIAALHEQLSALDPQDSSHLPVVFLCSLLGLLALKAAGHTDGPSKMTRSRLEASVTHFAQRTLLTLPQHHYSILALELFLEYEPLLLVSDRRLASNAVQGRIIPPLLSELALHLDLDTAPARLRRHLHSVPPALSPDLLDDCLKCWRLCLRDDVLGGVGRQGEKRHTMGETLLDTMDLLKALLKSDDLPSGYIFAYHSLLCQASKLEYMFQIKEDWKDLNSLGRAIEDHKEACEQQRQILKASFSSLRPGEALAMTQLLDMQLHSAYCWTSGSAMFYAVMGGARGPRSPSTLDIKQALDVSDQIIERFAESTREKHALEPQTRFLIKYGSNRMEDLELALLNFVSTMDNLKLQGTPYIPPTRHTTTHVLYTVKDVMEGQAAKMKGWGGLHERVHMHLLLIRDCANSLGSVGSRLTGQTGSEAIAKGCLWASSARLLRSLHRLLGQWKEWNALGQVKIHTPCRAKELVMGNNQETVTTSDSNNLDLLPDDLFFDWDLWEGIPV